MIRELKKQGYIDALRGYAILAVLLVHSAQSVPPLSPFLLFLRNHGSFGVQLFYVVSAFALFMSWHFRSEHERSPTRNFFIRRFFRIAPMFYLAIAIYLIDYGLAARYWAPNGVEWWFVAATALLGHGLHPETINSVVPGGWSVAAEMGFYLLLPLLFRGINNLGAALGLVAVSLVVYVVSQSMIDAFFAGVYPPAQQYLITSFKHQNFLAQLPVFAAGIAAYFLARDYSRNRRIAVAASALLAALLLLALLFPDAPMLHNHLSIGAMLALFTFVLACFPVKLIANRFCIFIGRISFSIYLMQFVVIDAFRGLGLTSHFPSGDMSWSAYFLLLTGVTAAVSWITYRTIEQPGIRLGRHIILRLESADERRANQQDG